MFPHELGEVKQPIPLKQRGTYSASPHSSAQSIARPTARCSSPPNPELREYKAVYVQSDAEIGLFSDEVVVNCAP
jgi:hypothetical protein